MTDYRDALRVELELLDSDLNQFRVFLDHVVPDVLLFNLGLDVLEQAGAVYNLTEIERLGRAAFSNARAAYESCLDALFLTSDPKDYDRYGALARAHEVLELADLRARRTTADVAIGLERERDARTPDELIEADGAMWESHSEGKAELLKRAYEDIRSDRRSHWSGMGRKKIADTIANSSSSDDGFAQMADFFYGLLSIHSHPRPRTDARIRNVDADGRMAYSPNPDDGSLAAGIAQAVGHLMRSALARRRELFLDRSDAGC